MADATLLRQYLTDYNKKASAIAPNYDADYAAYTKAVDEYNVKNQDWYLQNQLYGIARRVADKKALSAEDNALWLRWGAPYPTDYTGRVPDGHKRIAAPGDAPALPEAPVPGTVDRATVPLTEANIHEVSNPHSDLAQTELLTSAGQGSNPTPAALTSESAPLQDLTKLKGTTDAGILNRVLTGQLDANNTAASPQVQQPTLPLLQQLRQPDAQPQFQQGQPS